MVGNKVILAFLTIFLAFSFFFAVAQEGFEEQNVSPDSEIANETVENIGTQEAREIVDFQVFTYFEKSKIRRGESFEYYVVVKNSGTKLLERLKVSLILPEGIYSDEKEKSCENLNVGEECSLSFVLKTSLSTSVGKKEIKVRVTYG